MNKSAKEFLKFAMLPILILGMLASIGLILRFLGLPATFFSFEYLKGVFEEYGYAVIFFGALAEGLLFANWYLPGSVVVVMGVALAGENGNSVIITLGLIILAFFLTAVFNYFLGRYGWYKLLLKFGLEDVLDKAKRRLERHGMKIILGTNFHPNVGSLTATSAGVLRLPFGKFAAYTLASLVFWNLLWGALVLTVGPQILDLITLKYSMMVIAAWVVVMLGVFLWRRRSAGVLVRE